VGRDCDDESDDLKKKNGVRHFVRFFFIMSLIPVCLLDFTMLYSSKSINHIMHLLSSNPYHINHSTSVFLNDLQGFMGEIP
jgi:hypothetical protein